MDESLRQLERTIGACEHRIDAMIAAGDHRRAIAEVLRATPAIDGFIDAIEPTLEMVLPYAERFRAMCQRIYAAACRSGAVERRFGDGFTLVASFPRSGNTLLMAALRAISQGYRLEAPGTWLAYNASCIPDGLDRPCFVKDHDSRASRLFERTIYAVRDGRNAIISLAYMMMKQGAIRIDDPDDIAGFIGFLKEQFVYGDWASNVRWALEARAQKRSEQLVLARYEEFLEDPTPTIAAVLPETGRADVEAALPSARRRAAMAYRLPEWGGQYRIEDGAFFAPWQQARGGNYWREVLTAKARRAFHETGATELLIELGYETDPLWWKAG